MPFVAFIVRSILNTNRQARSRDSGDFTGSSRNRGKTKSVNLNSNNRGSGRGGTTLPNDSQSSGINTGQTCNKVTGECFGPGGSGGVAR